MTGVHGKAVLPCSTLQALHAEEMGRLLPEQLVVFADSRHDERLGQLLHGLGSRCRMRRNAARRLLQGTN